jgi:hypothetical protein
VDFVIAGTQKGSTTALDRYLRDHPQVCMADRKELHFFDEGDSSWLGAVRRLRYHAHFSPGATHILLGEATPAYMYMEPVARRIWEYNPAMKWIMVLRNPIDRAFSHWNMESGRGIDDLPFSEALLQESVRSRKALPNQHPVYSYVDRGFYTEQIRRVWRFFPKGQTLILKSDDLRGSPAAILRQVTEFLGVSPFDSVEETEVFANPHHKTMGENEAEYLRAIFEHDILALERMLDWDCADWLR